MSSSPEDEFSKLRCLLSLKRHEQPPEGYFERLPNQITASLELESPTQPAAREEASPEGWVTWILRTLEQFQARPAVAGAFGVLVCAALVWGVILFENTDPTPATLPALLTEVAPASVGMIDDSALAPVTANAVPILATNFPMFQEPNLFDLIDAGQLPTTTVGHQP